MCDLSQEEFWIVLLNQANKIIIKIRISSGGIDGTYADVRSILREALLHRATGIILCHNHPSGNNHPSSADIQLTESIKQATQTMNITLCDHLIVCDGTYYSFADSKNL
jgi:DNA repair protein RadC